MKRRREKGRKKYKRQDEESWRRKGKRVRNNVEGEEGTRQQRERKEKGG